MFAFSMASHVCLSIILLCTKCACGFRDESADPNTARTTAAATATIFSTLVDHSTRQPNTHTTPAAHSHHRHHSGVSYSADIVVFYWDNQEQDLKLLTIRRMKAPFLGNLALPGGHVHSSAHVPDAAKVLREVTGIKNLNLIEVGIFDKPGRDPRGNFSSTAFVAVAPNTDDTRGAFQPVKALVNESWAFDHRDIVIAAIKVAEDHVQELFPDTEIINAKSVLDQSLVAFQSHKPPPPQEKNTSVKYTVDAVVFYWDVPDQVLHMLTMTRTRWPFTGSLALPGGFVDRSEDLKTEAAKTLEHKTSMKNLTMTFVGVFDKPGRDPRGNAVDTVFLSFAPYSSYVSFLHWKAAGLDYKPNPTSATFQPLEPLATKNWAFDHKQIVTDAIKVAQNSSGALLPDKSETSAVKNALDKCLKAFEAPPRTPPTPPLWAGLVSLLIGCGCGGGCVLKRTLCRPQPYGLGPRRQGRQLEFKGRFVSGQQFFVASFPGAFSKDWHNITEVNEQLSIACVFFPDGDSDFYGKHCRPCKCKEWYDGIDPEYPQWTDGKAPFGCLWSQRWWSNCQECLGVDQIPVVVYKPGKTGVRTSDGLGFSQLGEVQRLASMATLFECDLNDFRARVLPAAKLKGPLPPN